MFATAVLLLFTALLSGCATVDHRPLSQEASSRLQDKSVTHTAYQTPDFAAFTAGKAAFGLIGAAVMISEGNSIVKENAIPDPAITIGQGIVDRMVAGRNAAQVASAAIASGDNIETLLATYKGANILVDVRTINWMFNYYPTDWAHYKVTYAARVRLIDSASKTVTAETMCTTVQGDDANPPTKDQLLQDKAALLKEYLNKGAATCIDLVATQLLRIDSSKPVTSANRDGQISDAVHPAVGNYQRPLRRDPGPAASPGSAIVAAAPVTVAASAATATNIAAERQVTGDEFGAHFSRFGKVAATTASHADLVLEIGTSGRLFARDGAINSTGNYRIKSAESQICLVLHNSNGGHRWKMLQDCYRLFDQGGNNFVLRSVADATFISYAKN